MSIRTRGAHTSYLVGKALIIVVCVSTSCSPDAHTLPYQSATTQSSDSVTTNLEDLDGDGLPDASPIRSADSEAAPDDDYLAALDKSIPLASYAAFEYLYDDLDELSAASDLVFVGRVVDYVEEIIVKPAHSGLPDGEQDIFDAVVFSVDELLLGDPTRATGTVQVAMFVLARASDGMQERIPTEPIDLLAEGILNRQIPGGPRYLVFAHIWKNERSALYRPDLYYFTTSGGVAPVSPDDVVGYGKSIPLSRPIVVSEDGTGLPTDRQWDLDYVRGAVGSATEEPEDPLEDPVEDIVGEDPGQGEVPVDDGAEEDPAGSMSTTSSTTTIPDVSEGPGEGALDERPATTLTVPSSTTVPVPVEEDPPGVPGDELGGQSGESVP